MGVLLARMIYNMLSNNSESVLTQLFLAISSVSAVTKWSGPLQLDPCILVSGQIYGLYIWQPIAFVLVGGLWSLK